jgi:hypothetical protein
MAKRFRADPAARRAPAEVARAIDDLLAGTPAELVHIGARDFAEAFAHAPNGPLAAAVNAIGDPQVYLDAVRRDGDLAIPTGRYLNEVAMGGGGDVPPRKVGTRGGGDSLNGAKATNGDPPGGARIRRIRKGNAVPRTGNHPQRSLSAPDPVSDYIGSDFPGPDQGRNSDNARIYHGGRHGELTGRKYRNDKLDSHHIPAKFAYSNIMDKDKPAIQMDKCDHKITKSNGSGQEAILWRARQEELIDQGRYMDAMQMDIDNIRDLFGGKYDHAIEEALIYARRLIISGKIKDIGYVKNIHH